jgi:hypothetical protein
MKGKFRIEKQVENRQYSGRLAPGRKRVKYQDPFSLILKVMKNDDSAISILHTMSTQTQNMASLQMAPVLLQELGVCNLLTISGTRLLSVATAKNLSRTF